MDVLDDITVRLAVAKAGAHRYLNKPIDVNKLIRSLHSLTNQSVDAPFKILLIDDDPDFVEYHASIIQQSGMDVKTLTNPLLGLNVLAEYKPDVLVLDVYMPDCSGIELAQAIRQDDDYALMPVMFLSTEHSFSRQLEILNFGGDDFSFRIGLRELWRSQIFPTQ